MEEIQALELYPSMQVKEESIEVIQGEEGQEDILDYPSFRGKGMEEVIIPRPPAYQRHFGINYPSMELGEDIIQIKDAVPFITKQINEAFAEGNYGILHHFAKIVEGSDVFDQTLIPQVKTLAEEAKTVKSPEEGKSLLIRVNKFLSEIRMERRPGL